MDIWMFKRGLPHKPHRIALLVALAVLVVLLIVVTVASRWYHARQLEIQRAQVVTEVLPHGNALAAAISQRLALLEGIRAYTLTNLESLELLGQGFPIVAGDLYDTSPGIRTFTISPNGVHQWVYPLEGNEGVLGHDIIADERPNVRADVEEMIESELVVLSGPYELRQGGLGLVARRAIYDDDDFWGLVALVLDLPPVLEEAGIGDTGSLAWAIQDNDGVVFYGNPDVFDQDPAISQVKISQETWQVAGVPVDGWEATLGEAVWVFQGAGLIIALLLTGLVYFAVNHQARLAFLVAQRSGELTKINEQLRQEVTDRKQAAETLQKSEERFRMFSELASDYVYSIVVEADGTGRIEWISEAFTHITGYTQKESEAGERWRKTTHPDDLALVAERVRVLYAGQEDVSEFRIITKGGETRWIRDYVRPIWDEEQGRVVRIYGAAQDITERKQAEEALRNSEEQYRTLAEASHDIIVTLDHEGRILYSNRFAAELFGKAVHDLVGKNIAEIFPPEVTARQLASIQEVFRGGEAIDREARTLFPNSTIWLDTRLSPIKGVNGETTSVLVVSRDITQRKQAEEALQAANDQLNALINALPDRVITFDEDGRFLDMHSKFAIPYSYQQSPINQYLHDIEELPDEVADLVLSTIRQAIESDQLQTVEYRIPGDLIEWDEGRVVPLQKTVNGKKTVLWLTRNISQQKVAEAQSQKYAEQVRLLYEVGKLLGNTLDLEELYDNMHLVIYGIMPCDSLVISSYNADDKLIRCVHLRHEGMSIDVSDFPPIPLEPEGKGIQSTAIRTGKSLLLTDCQADIKTTENVYFGGHQGIYDPNEAPEDEDTTRSALIIPLQHRGRVIGVIQVQSYQVAAFSEDHLRIIEALAPQIAATTMNARLYQSERKQREFSEALRNTAAVISSSLDVDEVLVYILAQMKTLVQHDGANIMRIDQEIQTARVTHHCDCYAQNGLTTPIVGKPLPSSAIAPAWLQLIADNQPILVSDTQTNPDWVKRPETAWIRSYIAAPIRVKDTIFGLLNLDSATPGFFNQDHLEQLQVFADQAATAINNAQLYDAVNRHAGELERRVIERTAQLQSSVSRIEAILNSSNDVIILLDLDGTIQQGNPAFYQLFGYNADESYGRPLLTLVAPESINPLTEVLHLVEESGESTRIELVARHKNGSTFDIGVALSSVRKGEAVTGIICSIHDITQRKLMERSLRTSLGKERELGDLKSRFVSMASHELRTPLATIMATSDSLQHYFDRMNEEQKTKRFTKIRNQITHMTKMLDDVLTVGKLEDGATELKLEEFNLDALFEEIVNEFRQTEPACQIVYSSAGECGAISADPKLARQIVTNLLSNAIKYSPEGSTVNLTLTCDEDKIVWQVKDEGIGIPVEDQERLFEPFHRAANVGAISGTGLGLAITKRAVELHGGEIICESKTDSGTTFTITMPRSTFDIS